MYNERHVHFGKPCSRCIQAWEKQCQEILGTQSPHVHRCSLTDSVSMCSFVALFFFFSAFLDKDATAKVLAAVVYYMCCFYLCFFSFSILFPSSHEINAHLLSASLALIINNMPKEQYNKDHDKDSRSKENLCKLTTCTVPFLGM